MKRYARLWASAILGLWVCAFIGTAGLAQSSPERDRSLCVLVPHFKDDYWLSVAFGLEREAARQNVKLSLYEAGGYKALTTQIEQIRACAKSNAGGILLGAVSSDHPDLLSEVARAAQSVPVFGLVNELHSDALSGRVGVDWRDMGRSLGRHLAERFPMGSSEIGAVLISGPKVSGWAAPLEAGLRAGIAGSAVTILEVYGADTGLRQQLDLVQIALREHPEAQVLIGSAPAIEAAMGIARSRRQTEAIPLLFSSYVNHSTKRGLLNGNVAAAPFDDPARQGMLAVRQAIGLAEPANAQKLVGPPISLLASGGADVEAIIVSPPGYFPNLE
ncbi:MAG: TMAO reductase system periplasmic protein TorT [Pseudomonadota bacterium]